MSLLQALSSDSVSGSEWATEEVNEGVAHSLRAKESEVRARSTR